MADQMMLWWLVILGFAAGFSLAFVTVGVSMYRLGRREGLQQASLERAGSVRR